MDTTGHEFLPIGQAAGRWGLSQRTLRRRAQAGRIQKVIRDGRTLYAAPVRSDADTQTGQTVTRPDVAAGQGLMLATAFRERGELVRHLERQVSRAQAGRRGLVGIVIGLVVVIVGAAGVGGWFMGEYRRQAGELSGLQVDLAGAQAQATEAQAEADAAQEEVANLVDEVAAEKQRAERLREQLLRQEPLGLVDL